MSKELEALERIKDCLSWCAYDGKEVGMYKNDFELIEKSLKALEIIKEKVPLIYLLAGFVGKYDPEEIEIIKEVYTND